MKLYYKSRDAKYEAKAEYKDGITIVKKGSKIRLEKAKHFKEGRNKAFICRNDKQIVSEDGLVLADCEFNSPSIAAQFVTGSVLNGKMFWHLKDGKTLKSYLEGEE